MVEHQICEATDDLNQRNFRLEQWRVLFGW